MPVTRRRAAPSIKLPVEAGKAHGRPSAKRDCRAGNVGAPEHAAGRMEFDDLQPRTRKGRRLDLPRDDDKRTVR